MNKTLNLILLSTLVVGSVVYATTQVVNLKREEKKLKEVRKIIDVIEIDPITGKVL